MDTFFEQIIGIRKGAKQYAALIGIWLLVLVISAAVLLFLGKIGIIAPLLVVGAFYGGYYLSKRLSVEYEYIITNGSMDVDKIVAKSSRKRVASFELAGVESIEKFNANSARNYGDKKVVFACNENDNGAYVMTVKGDKGGTVVVFAPNDRIKGAVVKFVPKYIANSAFKD